MDWHRTVVSILIAVTTVFALAYMSSLAPEATALVPAATEAEPAVPAPEGQPVPAGEHRYADRREPVLA